MAPRWVKKREGRIVPYDEGRIARAVLRAGRRAGPSEELERLAREIARSVTLFLSRRPERTPETTTIAQAMEDALEETGHAPVARLAREWRDWRRRRQAEVRVREAEGDAAAPGVEVLSRSAARPWSKPRIVDVLVQQAGLERDAAEDVARVVEERVFAAGLNRISTTLLRELIDAEMFERGFSAQLGRLEVLGLPKPDLEALALGAQGRAPLALEDKVARAALERYALDELLAGPGATAHRRGDIHLLGLGRPFRAAAGGLDAVAVAATDLDAPVDAPAPAPAPSALAAALRLVRLTRRASTAHEVMYGLVGVDRALAPWAEPGRPADPPAAPARAEVDDAVDALLDALAAPCPDDLPPAPETALVVEPGPPGSRERAALARLLAGLERRGARGAGVRLAVRLAAGEAAPSDVEPLLRALLRAAHAGAGVDLCLGEGAVGARGMVPGATTVQVAFLNLAGLALGAGRGQRSRLSQGVERAVEAALDAFHRRRRHAMAAVVRPDLPLFGADATEPRPGWTLAGVPLVEVGDALGVVGLDAAMRWLTGEGPTENPRVADLAGEVLGEVRAVVVHSASRLGLGRVVVEEAPPVDAGIRLAALDLDRFGADARELLGDAPGWDTGPTLRPDEPDPLVDVRVRLRLARRLGGPLVLPRPVLAALPPEALAPLLADLLRRAGTARLGPGAG